MQHTARQDIVDALGDSDVFGSLTEEELARLVAYGTTVAYRAGQLIFQKGDPGDSLAVVLRGRVKISSISLEGREALLTFVEPGHTFGEIALLDGKPRSADATAAEATELFVLKRRDLLTYLERHPEIALRIIGVLCQRLRRSTEIIEDVVLLQMGPRIAKALLRLVADYGRRHAAGVMIDLKLSQRELGNYVGLARENINRQLGSWRQAGVITLDGGHIVVRDLDRLRAIAQETD